METSVIVMALLGGIVSGAGLAVGAIGLVSGRMPYNPARIDWSIAEGRALSAIATVESVYVALFTLVTALQVAASGMPPMWLLPMMVIVPFGGTLATIAVGRCHDARNPVKRYWR